MGVKTPITHPGAGGGSSSRLRGWAGKDGSPNLHIPLLLDLKHKIQGFFTVFQKQSSGHSQLWKERRG